MFLPGKIPCGVDGGKRRNMAQKRSQFPAQGKASGGEKSRDMQLSCKADALLAEKSQERLGKTPLRNTRDPLSVGIDNTELDGLTQQKAASYVPHLWCSRHSSESGQNTQPSAKAAGDSRCIIPKEQ